MLNMNCASRMKRVCGSGFSEEGLEERDGQPSVVANSEMQDRRPAPPHGVVWLQPLSVSPHYVMPCTPRQAAVSLGGVASFDTVWDA